MAQPFDSAKGLVARFQQVKTDRSIFERRWDQIRRYQRPDAAPFLGQEFRGTRYTGAVYDNTAEDAADNAAAGIGGLLTGQAIDWHGWEWQDDDLQADYEAKAWLESVTKKQLGAYRNPLSRFGQSMDACYLDLIDFANSCIFIKERRGALPLFLPRPIQQIYWLENEDQELDTYFWNFELSARQAVRMFGYDAVPEEVAKAARDPQKCEERSEYLHAAFPNDDPQAGKNALGPKAIASKWIAVKTQQIVREGGYRTQPYIGFRWRVRAGERYGRGPSDKALADVAVLQQFDKLNLRGYEKSIDPSLMVVDDGIVGEVSLRSSEMTFVRPEVMFRGGDPIRAIETGARPDIGEEGAQFRRDRIYRAFLREMLQIMRDPRATATQVLEVREEQFRTAAPVVNGLEAESLGPLANRTFDLMLHGGLFPPPPAQVGERSASPTFQSPIARAQRLAYVRGFAQWIDLAKPVADIDATVLDVVDFEAGMRRAAEALSVPYEVVRSPEKVVQLREKREAEQRQIMEQEAAKDASTVAKNMAPVLKAAGDAGLLAAGGEDATAVQPGDFAEAA